MRVERFVPGGVQKAQRIAVTGVAARCAHHARRSGIYGGAFRRGKVGTVMELCPLPAHRVGTPAVAGGAGAAALRQRKLQRKIRQVAFLPHGGGRGLGGFAVGGAAYRQGARPALQCLGGLLGKF